MYLRQSTASQEIILGPFVDSTDGNTAETSLTIANTDIKVWKHGGTTVADKNSGGATHISGGRYYAVLDATDTDTIGLLEVFVHVSGALPVIRRFQVLDEAVYDVICGTTAPSTYAGGDTSGTTTLLSRIGGALTITSGRVDADVTHIATAAVSTSTAQIGVNVVNFGGSAGTFSSGRPEVNSTHWAGTAVGSATVRADLINVAGVAVSTSSAQIGVNVVNAGGTAWGSGAITAASIASDAITAAKVASDVSAEIADAVWDEARSGHVSAGTFGEYVSANVTHAAGTAWGSGAITAASIATGAITSAKFAAGAIDAAAIANGAIDAATFAADVDAEFLSYIVDDATRIDASALNTLSSHDPGATIGTSTLTQTQVTGGAYALNSASFAFNAALDLTATQKASVNTEADAALADINLDHLVKSAVDTDFATTVHLNSVIGHLADDGTTATFDRTTDSLEVIGSGSLVVASVTGAVGSVTGAVGSVSGNVDGSVGSVSAGVTLADDAITAAKFDESTAFPLKQDDSGASAVARTGADADTLETLSDQIDGVGGGGGLTQADVRAAIGLAAANLDTQLGAIKTTADNIEADTQDLQTQVGTDGNGLTAIPWNAAWDTEVQSECEDAIVAYGLDHLVFASVAGTDVADNSIIAKLVSKSATADWDSFINTTDALEAIRDKSDDIETDTQNIQSRIPAALVSGRMDASVGAMASNVFTAAAVASDAVTELQSGLATSAAIGTPTVAGTTLFHFFEADIIVDTGTTPWQMLHKRTSDDTTILTQNLKTAANANVTSTDSVVGRRESP